MIEKRSVQQRLDLMRAGRSVSFLMARVNRTDASINQDQVQPYLLRAVELPFSLWQSSTAIESLAQGGAGQGFFPLPFALENQSRRQPVDESLS